MHVATIVTKTVDFGFLHNDAVNSLAILFGHEIHVSRPQRWLQVGLVRVVLKVSSRILYSL